MRTNAPAPQLTPPFPSDLVLLEQRYQHWLPQQLGAPVDDRDRHLYNLSLIVPYPQWQALLDYVVSGILMPRNDRLTVMIEGPSRTGKSTFAIEVLMQVLHATRETFGRTHSTDEADDDINPVIAVKGSTGQTADFMRSLLNAVDLPTHGTAEQMLTRFGAYCRRHFVRVLLVDDVHVTNSREAGLENFYKRLLDIVPCIIFTAVDFNQSPLPQPKSAPQRRAATLQQIWGRALGSDKPDGDPTIRFLPEDPTAPAGRAALAGAVKQAGASLALKGQAGSDLTTPATMSALVALHGGKLAAILSDISRAGAAAVGTSERVGSRELGLSAAPGGES